MTLEPYDAQKLDQTILRIMDIAGELRQISLAKQRDPELPLAMHDKKALLWITQLEQWAADSRMRMERAKIQRRGESLARKIENKV